ncbi:MAG TPA: nuclear transport factor 2 family protein [Sphingomicrobium sp.]|nr:nuclear transport factor 2 family protein [Sphingomicrobium sp.]
MTRNKLILFVALMPVAVGACRQQVKPDRAAIEQQLRDNEARWNRAYANHDARALAGLYADDAALANPGAPLVTGKDAIARETAAFAADPGLSVEFGADRVQVARSGDLAYTRGHYTMTMTDPSTGQPATSNGNYLTVWQRQRDGRWKAVEDFITPGPEIRDKAAQ